MHHVEKHFQTQTNACTRMSTEALLMEANVLKLPNHHQIEMKIYFGIFMKWKNPKQ